jgi:hypothetical protein
MSVFSYYRFSSVSGMNHVFRVWTIIGPIAMSTIIRYRAKQAWARRVTRVVDYDFPGRDPEVDEFRRGCDRLLFHLAAEEGDDIGLDFLLGRHWDEMPVYE